MRVVPKNVCEDVAVGLWCEVLNSPEHGLPDRDDPLPNLHRDRLLAVPPEKLKERTVHQLVVHQHRVEQLGQSRPHRPLAHSGVTKQEHDRGR